MASISKRRKLNDRISNLPNNLISHILSFLSAKDAVRTSALSTHWNQQWTSITHLKFVDYDLRDLRDLSQLKKSSSFMNFVYRVLLFKVTRLDLFSLHCRFDYGITRVKDWISIALSRNVRQIDVTVNVDERHHIQLDCLFSSKTLVVLKLGRGFLLRVPTVVSLVNLKTLHFNSVEFEDSESLSKIISSCPVLEELEIEGTLGESVGVLKISSLSLKKLVLNQLYSVWFTDIGQLCPYEVVLNTPSLQYLEHDEYDGVPNIYKIKTLQNLDRARLCVSISKDQLMHNDYQFVYRPLPNLFVAISNVRILYLSGLFVESFHHCCYDELNIELPDFPRLTDLKIGGIHSDRGLSLLIAFLQSSPLLTSLSFSIECSRGVWDPPTVVPICMRSNLKAIEVKRFYGQKLEFSIVKYFLEKTAC